MKTTKPRVAELLKRYERAEMDRMVAFYRLQPVEELYRTISNEVDEAQKRIEAIVAELRDMGYEDDLTAYVRERESVRYRSFTG